MKSSHILTTIAIAAFTLLLSSAQQTPSSPSSTTAPLPQHTAIYTTTLTNNASPQITTLATITLLMPRSVPNFPTDGPTITGTAISHLAAPLPDDSSNTSTTTTTWDITSTISWVLTGNVPTLGTLPLMPLTDIRSTLSSTHSTTINVTTTYYHFWFLPNTWHVHSRLLVTYFEPVGADYPATIVRTGATFIDATVTALTPVSTMTPVVFSDTAWVTYTTTMVMVVGDPTGLSSIVG